MTQLSIKHSESRHMEGMEGAYFLITLSMFTRPSELPRGLPRCGARKRRCMNKGVRKGPLEPTIGTGSAGRPRTAQHRCAGWNRCSGNISDHTISFFTQLSTPWTRSVLLFSVSLNFIRFSQDAFTHKKGVASSLPRSWDWNAIVTAAERASAFSG